MFDVGFFACLALLIVTARMAILSSRQPGRTFRVLRYRYGPVDSLTFGDWMRRYFWLYLAVTVVLMVVGWIQLH